MATRAWVCALILGGFSRSALPAEALEAADEALLEVTVNGETQPDWALVKLTRDGKPWVQRMELQSWGIQLADNSGYARLPRDALLPLNELPGVEAMVDRAQSRLQVDVQPALLTKHEFHSPVSIPQATASPLGAFFNYDLGAARYSGSNQLRALTELGIVHGDWVARSSWYATAASGQAANLRLDSNVTVDSPATRSSLQWGDTFARLGTNAEAVRIAGMSWGTDFSVTPTFITVPLPTFSNIAATPGTVDLYVNGAKTQQLSVPGGPFSVSNIPVTTGAGELTVVTHDLLGRAQVFTQSYYISPQMLQAGLTAWDFQLGSKRLQYGIVNNLYSGWLAAGGERYGVTDRLTAQWRVEADETGAAASAQWLALTPGNALLSLGPTCGATGRFGCQLSAGYELDRYRFGYGLNVGYSTTGYVPVAAAERTPTARWQLTPHVQASGPYGINLMLGGTWREIPGQPRTIDLNFTAGKNFLGGGHLDLVFSTVRGGFNSSYLWLIYTHGIDRERSVSATAYAANGQSGAATTLQRNLPAGDGYGYMLRAAQDSVSSVDASAQWNSDSFAAAATAQRQGGRTALSAEISGAAVWLANDVLAARRVDGSFAVVHAQSLPGLLIYVDEQPVAHTDANGNAVLAKLRPFEVNRIDLDPTALPLSLAVPQMRFEVTPYRRGGVYVDIPVRLSATVRLRLTNGQAVPAGARIQQQGGTAPVGTEGMAYVEGLAGDNVLQVEWEGGQCQAHLHLPVPPSANQTDDSEPLPCAAYP